jgi:flavodoxin
MMKHAVIYSSVSGNTRSVGEAVLEVLPPGSAIFPVQKAPDPDDFDFLALGFWVHRVMPDPRMRRYMQRVRGKRVAWFGTLSAWPHSDSADRVRQSANGLLETENTLLGGFLCQGRLEAKRFAAAMDPVSPRSRHTMTEERRARLLEAARHPNEEDFAAARAAFRRFLG